jgi:hypothetical protein
VNGFGVHDEEQKNETEADAATRRLRKGFRAARSIVRDYRSELRRRMNGGVPEPKADTVFRFDR